MRNRGPGQSGKGAESPAPGSVSPFRQDRKGHSLAPGAHLGNLPTKSDRRGQMLFEAKATHRPCFHPRGGAPQKLFTEAAGCTW